MLGNLSTRMKDPSFFFFFSIIATSTKSTYKSRRPSSWGTNNKDDRNIIEECSETTCPDLEMCLRTIFRRHWQGVPTSVPQHTHLQVRRHELGEELRLGAGVLLLRSLVSVFWEICVTWNEPEPWALHIICTFPRTNWPCRRRFCERH